MADKVNEKHEINTIGMLFDIKTDLANLNTKVDGFNDSFKDISKRVEANEKKTEFTYELAKQNARDIKALQKKSDSSSNNHNQWFLAIVSAVIGAVGGSISNLF